MNFIEFLLKYKAIILTLIVLILLFSYFIDVKANYIDSSLQWLSKFYGYLIIPIGVIGLFIAIFLNRKRILVKRQIFSPEERDKILNHFGNRCSICGYNVKDGLQIHHKNENPSDNRIENLTVLCYACHKRTHMKNS